MTISRALLRSSWPTAALLMGMLTLGGNPARADLQVTFDFEEQAVGNTTKITSTKSGLTTSISRVDGAAIGIVNLGGSPPSFGARSISNFVSNFTATGGILIIDFSQAVSAASLKFGDFGADDDSPVILTAFSGLNGTGSDLTSSTTSYPGSSSLGNGVIGSLSVAAAGILSLEFSSGGPFPNSLYSDNLTATVTTTPEPSTMVMAGATAVAFLGYRLRRRRAGSTA